MIHSATEKDKQTVFELRLINDYLVLQISGKSYRPRSRKEIWVVPTALESLTTKQS